MAVKYSINAGQQLEFVVPGRNQNMRWAVHSVCHSVVNHFIFHFHYYAVQRILGRCQSGRLPRARV